MIKKIALIVSFAFVPLFATQTEKTPTQSMPTERTPEMPSFWWNELTEETLRKAAYFEDENMQQYGVNHNKCTVSPDNPYKECFKEGDPEAAQLMNTIVEKALYKKWREGFKENDSFFSKMYAYWTKKAPEDYRQRTGLYHKADIQVSDCIYCSAPEKDGQFFCEIRTQEKLPYALSLIALACIAHINAIIEDQQ